MAKSQGPFANTIEIGTYVAEAVGVGIVSSPGGEDYADNTGRQLEVRALMWHV